MNVYTKKLVSFIIQSDSEMLATVIKKKNKKSVI